MAAPTNVKPTVVWVPGLLHTPEHFQPIVSALAKVSIPSVSFSLPNVGAGAATAAPYDDLKKLRAMLEELVDEGKEVLLISHSYGGVPASQAIRGLQKSERVKTGQPGGIIRIVFMAAFALPEGESTWTFTEGRQPPEWATREVSEPLQHLNLYVRQPLLSFSIGKHLETKHSRMHHQLLWRYSRRVSEVLGSKTAACKSQHLHNASVARLLGRRRSQDLHRDNRGCSITGRTAGGYDQICRG